MLSLNGEAVTFCLYLIRSQFHLNCNPLGIHEKSKLDRKNIQPAREITQILREFGKGLRKKILRQDIGLIVQEREQSIPNKPDKTKRIWLLLGQIETDIKQALNEWREAMSK